MDKLNETIRATIGNLVVENLQLGAVVQNLQTQLAEAQALVAKLQPAPLAEPMAKKVK